MGISKNYKICFPFKIKASKLFFKFFRGFFLKFLKASMIKFCLKSFNATGKFLGNFFLGPEKLGFFDEWNFKKNFTQNPDKLPGQVGEGFGIESGPNAGLTTVGGKCRRKGRVEVLPGDFQKLSPKNPLKIPGSSVNLNFFLFFWKKHRNSLIIGRKI